MLDAEKIKMAFQSNSSEREVPQPDISLPQTIAAYVAAKNAHDPDAVAQTFAADGIAYDEGKIHRGRAEIAEWARDAMNRYRMTMSPLSVTGKEGKTVLTARVEGNFPGSPIELNFKFELGEDGIRSLKVGG
ncbi:MAG TPA: nuclear transport factor 2 family protein [Pseudolabrys sp.]|nr:nuclear transport factor 2 family protein [Pseudolabrys sp.]